MAVSITEAAISAGISRSTIYKWFKKGLLKKNDETGMVELRSVLQQMGGERRTTRGRAAGWAHKKKCLSKVSDLGMTLEQSIVLLSAVFGAMSEAQRSWVKRAILARIDDPNLVIIEEVPIDASQMVISETQQEQIWNNVMVRGTLSPKVLACSPEVRAWGEKIKRLGIYEKENIPLPESLYEDLKSMGEPPKRRALKVRTSQNRVSSTGRH